MTIVTTDSAHLAAAQPRAAGALIVGVGAVGASGPLAWVAAAAASWGCPVVVVHAWSENQPGVPPVGTSAWNDIDTWQAEVAQPARAAVDSLRRQGVDATMDLRCADPAEALLAVARPRDQLVIGAGTAGPSGRLLHGHVVHELLARSTCPVAVVPENWRPVSDGRPAVVVGWDGSRGSHNALRWAASEAHRLNGRLVLVRAFRTTDHTSATSQTAEEMLADARSVAAEQDVTDIRFARIPDAVDGTAHALDKAAQHAHVLVLGAAHARWLTAAMHSGLPERTAELATCPVVVMPREPGEHG